MFDSKEGISIDAGNTVLGASLAGCVPTAAPVLVGEKACADRAGFLRPGVCGAGGGQHFVSGDRGDGGGQLFYRCGCRTAGIAGSRVCYGAGDDLISPFFFP